MRLVIDLQGAQGVSHTRGIGRYSRELALAMARESGEHEVIVALNGAFPDTADLLIDSFSAILPPRQIRVWDSPREVKQLGPHAARRCAAEHVRAQFLASCAPDLVHVTSLFEGAEDNVVSRHPAGLERLPYVATCYDLIPLILHEQYLGNKASPSPFLPWYYQRLQEMSLCEGLLAISSSSRQEAIQYLNFPQDRVFNLRAGVHPKFRPAQLPAAAREALLRRYGLRDNFILFVGATDVRKNQAGLIAAYGLLPAALRTRFQLLLVVGSDEEQRRVREKGVQAGLAQDELVVLPFVEEEDLTALYGVCGLFVLPSLHEGFGLPAAEAMACGAPVIASNTTSLPEVMGREDALFDPTSPQAIATCMRKVLENDELRRSLAEYGPKQAATFTWEASARRAWEGLEHLQAQRSARQVGRKGHRVLRPRPRLAYVAPLPPQHSGVAEYSRVLVPALARHYDITLVSEVATVEDFRLAANFPVLSPAAFLETAGTFDRVLYHLGNADCHRFQIEDLLPAVPGVVVLHDGFLSGYRERQAHARGDAAAFLRDLYVSHGYSALQVAAQQGPAAAVPRFPCTLPVVRHALGVIQPSRGAAGLLAEHYGEAIGRRSRLIPLPFPPYPRPDRVAARQRLGIGADDFLVCSFGTVTPQQLRERLAHAWSTVQAGIGPGKAQLTFVGEIPPAEMKAIDAATPIPARPRLTGPVTETVYRDWLAAADVAVQLGGAAQGDAVQAVTDCLAAGLALIVTADGGADALPEGVALSLPSGFDDAELARALTLLHGDAAERHRLGAAGRAYAEAELTADHVAARYHDAIEDAYGTGAAAAQAALLAALTTETGWAPDSEDTFAAAKAISGSLPLSGPPQFLIDISKFAHFDLRSGIQRVVREVCRHALGSPPQGYRVETVLMEQQGRLRSTHQAALRLLNQGGLSLAERPVEAAGGDILLCLDLNAEMDERGFAELRRLQRQGVQVVVVIYDLLPLQHPHWFPEINCKLVQRWYLGMLARADAAMCISRAVADEVRTLLDSGAVRRSRPLPVGWFHLGSDFHLPETESGREPNVAAALASAATRPTLLATGTVEPRKGHRQALAAFEELWAAGHDVGLVIVGQPGWKTEDLCARLSDHKEAGRRLHWLRQTGDAELWDLYGAASGLLMASEAEGFGLPLVEAACRNLPIIARDIPVFREIAGERAVYFSGTEGSALADTIRDWLKQREQGTVVGSDGIQVLSWQDSTKSLLETIQHKRWYYEWQAPTGSAS